MHNFKVGDTVRRTGSNVGGRNGRLIKTGDEVVITSIGSGYYLRFFDETSGWGADGFEAVIPKELTDEELAAEYRRLRENANEIAVKLKEAGYSLFHTKQGGSKTPLNVDQNQIYTTYQFIKTITTTKEI